MKKEKHIMEIELRPNIDSLLYAAPEMRNFFAGEIMNGAKREYDRALKDAQEEIDRAVNGAILPGLELAIELLKEKLNEES